MRTIILIALFAFTTGLHGTAAAQNNGDAERSAYIVRVAGCASCHTAPKGGKFLAGGRELK